MLLESRDVFTDKGMTWSQSFGDLEIIKESFHFRVFGNLAFHITDPNLDHIVSVLSNTADLQGSLVELILGYMVDVVDVVCSIALRTSMP